MRDQGGGAGLWYCGLSYSLGAQRIHRGAAALGARVVSWPRERRRIFTGHHTSAGRKTKRVPGGGGWGAEIFAPAHPSAASLREKGARASQLVPA